MGNNQNSKPVVYMDHHNGVTGVWSEKHHKAWQEQEKCAKSLGIDTSKKIPLSPFTALFTDNESKAESLDNFYTGTIKDYDELVKGCQVEKIRLFIPKHPEDTGPFYPIALEAMRCLIHGA